MTQTAIEWLLEEWPILESQIPPRIIEQAKAMEKEQMKKLFEKHYDETGYYSMTLEDAER
jgi:ferritin-like metal-binding protein YciE